MAQKLPISYTEMEQDGTQFTLAHTELPYENKTSPHEKLLWIRFYKEPWLSSFIWVEAQAMVDAGLDLTNPENLPALSFVLENPTSDRWSRVVGIWHNPHLIPAYGDVQQAFKKIYGW
jgi:hypothetical protein